MIIIDDAAAPPFPGAVAVPIASSAARRFGGALRRMPSLRAQAVTEVNHRVHVMHEVPFSAVG